MTTRFVLLGVLALCAAVPGSDSAAEAAAGKVVIKVATVAPRTQRAVSDAKRFNRDLAEATDGRVQFRTYYGGTAGDDATVLRKIRAGQIDAAPLGVQLVARFVKQAMVLSAPQTFFNYKQVDAVRHALSPEFNKEAFDNGFKVLSWWDMGKVRIFSKKPIRSFADLRTGRPWLYPESPLLKEFYRMINVTGVPLELGEVYGGLQTNMVDTVWISSVLAMAFQWHSKTEYVSARPVSIVQGAFVLSRKTWEKLSTEDRGAIESMTAKNMHDFQRRFRSDDARTYKKLLQRGFKNVGFSNGDEWRSAGKKLRERMVGRIYDRELLSRVEKITRKFGNSDTAASASASR